jgi:hypothetical protein
METVPFVTTTLCPRIETETEEVEPSDRVTVPLPGFNSVVPPDVPTEIATTDGVTAEVAVEVGDEVTGPVDVAATAKT